MDDYHSDGDSDVSQSEDEVYEHTQLLGYSLQPYLNEGILGLIQGFNSGKIRLPELIPLLELIMEKIGSMQAYFPRVSHIFNSLIKISGRLHCLINNCNSSKLSIWSNMVRLQDYNGRWRPYNKGVQRYLVETKVGFRILLSVPPRHACFGMTPQQLKHPNCVDAYPAKSYELSVHHKEETIFPLPYGGRFWTFEFTLSSNYLLLDEVFDILVKCENLDELNAKPVLSFNECQTDLQAYLDYVCDKHLELTCRPYTERPLSSHKNKRHRQKYKKIAAKYNCVYDRPSSDS